MIVLKNDPEILLSDSTCLSKRVFVHLSFCSRRRGEDRQSGSGYNFSSNVAGKAIEKASVIPYCSGLDEDSKLMVAQE